MGHIIDNAFAVGRRGIGAHAYYQDKLAGDLWVEGETAFDLARLDAPELHALLMRLRDDDDYHRTISENAARRFREVVDWDAEAQAVRELIESVVP